MNPARRPVIVADSPTVYRTQFRKDDYSDISPLPEFLRTIIQRDGFRVAKKEMSQSFFALTDD